MVLVVSCVPRSSSPMFQLFGRTPAQWGANLFEDNFAVIDVDVLKNTADRRLICSEANVQFCYNKAYYKNENVDYYEIIYGKDKLYSFIVYHNTSEPEALDLYKKLKTSLTIFDQYINTNRIMAGESLRAIMNVYRINSNWSCAHVAARIGFDLYFREQPHIVKNEINLQVAPDNLTPLHLAIQSELLPTIRAILDLKPELDLIDSKYFSILHFAAISTQEILKTILQLPGMFDRIHWKNEKGCTALHLACYVQKFENVFTFLRFGLTVSMLTLPPPKSLTRKSPSCQRPKEKEKHPRIVHFTEQDFQEGLSVQDIFCAGSPLHWAKQKRLIEKLISYSFPINVRNMNGDTPLHVMTKRSRLKCCITLLCKGANVKAQNYFGNSSLHHAVKYNDISITQTLVVFDAEVNAVNYVGDSVRHLAAKETGIQQEMILYVITCLGAKRCSPQIKGCTSGCAYNGTFEGRYNPNLFEATKNLDKIFKNYMNNLNFLKANQQPAEPKGSKRVSMLTLDGGGLKGLVTIQILIEIEKQLQHPLRNYFRWIAGTSTGSFISVMLAIGRTLPQIRSLYFLVKDKIMCNMPRPYDEEAFEAIIKEEAKELLMKDLRTTYDKFVIVPATIFNLYPMRLHLFRSYPSHHELLGSQTPEPNCPHESQEQLVWKACRASSAAPTYFRSFGPFIDGGMIANNPTLDALTEFHFYNNTLPAVGRADEVEQLMFVMSIGTGKQLPEENEMIELSTMYSMNPLEIPNNIKNIKKLFNILITEVCNTEGHIVNR